MLKCYRGLCVALLLILLPMRLGAQVCQTGTIPATTPTEQFVDDRNGVVTDTTTGLMWKKCSEGQVWVAASNACSGGAAGFSWSAALVQAQTVNAGAGFLNKKDWRLPNIKELSSITEKQCVDPAVNLAVFPNTGSAWFWSASSHVSNGQYAYYINLIIGNGNWDVKTNGHQVRLVRGGD